MFPHPEHRELGRILNNLVLILFPWSLPHAAESKSIKFVCIFSVDVFIPEDRTRSYRDKRSLAKDSSVGKCYVFQNRTMCVC